MIGWIVGVVVAVVGFVLAGLVLFTAWTAQQVEKKLPPRGRFIDVDGARIHYLDEGTGPTLLLIHGLAGQMHNFTHSLLGKLRHDFRVVILDRPGSGYSTRPAKASATISVRVTINDYAKSIFCSIYSLNTGLMRLLTVEISSPATLVMAAIIRKNKALSIPLQNVASQPANTWLKKLVAIQSPIMSDCTCNGATLVTRESPIGERYSSPMVIITK
jgi:hypothetical protein